MGKRIVVWCFVLLVLANAAIFAVGGRDRAGGAQQVNLRFGWWGNDDRHDRTIKAIELYESRNPNIKIEPEPRGQSDRQKIAAELAGGNIADISQLNSPWMYDFTAGVDFFVDLSTKSSILDMTAFDRTFIRENCYYNGRLLALPLGFNYLTAYVDKYLADRFNIPTDLNSTSWTWEDFRNIGRTVHAQDPRYYFAIISNASMLEFIVRPYLAQRTGKQLVDQDTYTLNITRADLVDAFTYVTSLFTEGVTLPVQEANPHSTWTNTKWINREIVSHIQWTSLYDAVVAEFKAPHVPAIGVVPIAKDAKNTGVVIQPQALIGVSNKSRGIDEAVRFVSWFLNDLDAGRILATTRSIPISSRVQEMLVRENLIDKNLQDAITWTTARQGIVPNIVSTNAEIIETLTTAIEKVSLDASTVNDAADQAMRQIEDILGRMRR